MAGLIAKIASYQNVEEYKEQNWSGTFEEYLALVKSSPSVTRNSFQRAYDMIMGFGREEYIDSKKKLVHYPFFDDPVNNGADAVYGRHSAHAFGERV
jgi:serine protein kinase